MKKLKSIAISLRDLIRGRKFIARTVISCAVSFGCLVAFGIAWDTLYRFAATNSGVIMAAFLVAGQCFLYSKELSRAKAWFTGIVNAPAAPTAAKEKAKAPREKAPKSSAAKPFSNVAKELVDELNPTGTADEDDDEEEFEDDEYGEL